jgi:hypothetical protein
MGANQSKFCLLHLPAQSGKTRKMEEKIRDYKEQLGSAASGRRSIDIVISSNNRLLVQQTTARVKKDLGSSSFVSDSSSCDSDEEESNAVIKGDIFSWTCGGKGTKISPEFLSCKIVLDEIEMVIMCANKRRMTYLRDMLADLVSKPSFRKNPIEINIWIDEADRSQKLWSKFPDIAQIPAVKQITLISATIGGLWKVFSDGIRFHGYAVTYPSCYRGIKDFKHVLVEKSASDAAAFFMEVVRANPELLRAGKRIFAPGDCPRVSHEEIAAGAMALGCAALIINGTTKELRIPGEPPYDMRACFKADPYNIPEEFNQTLAKLYDTKGLRRFPFIITGCLCIQRGVTFQCAPVADHGGFLISDEIIPEGDADEGYQTAARGAGNVADFPEYIPPTIYTTAKMLARIMEKEASAMTMPRIVHERGLGPITKDDFELHMGLRTIDADRAHREFYTQEMAIEFGRTLGVFLNKRSDTVAPSALLDTEGKNPTCEYLLNRMWGISSEYPARMVPTKDKKWCVYWRPSLVKAVDTVAHV